MSEKRQFYKHFLSLAVLLVLQNVITLSVNLADNLMLGTYSEAALSGATAVNQIQFVYQQLMNALGDGLLILCTQYWGKKQTEPMRRIAAMALRFGLCICLVLFTLVSLFPYQAMYIFTTDTAIVSEGIKYLRIIRFTYLFFAMTQLMLASMRSVEMVKIAFYMSVLTFFINCGINFVLIYGHFGAPRLGIEGAAIGTLCARIVEFTVVAFYVLRRDDRLRLRIRDYLRLDHTYVRDYAKVTIPCLMASLIWGVNTALQTIILGHMTTEAIAANSVASTMFLLVKSMAVGAAAAASVIIGKAVGEGDEKKVRTYAGWLQQAFVVIGITAGLTLFLIRIPILGIYKLAPETLALANSFLIILCFVEVFMSYQMPTNGGIIKGGGDPGYLIRLDTISIVGVVIPMSVLAAFVFKAPPQIVVICLNADQFFKGIPAFIKCNYGHWMKKHTREVGA